MIYAVDIGSTLAGRNGPAFAWAKVPDTGGQPVASTDPEALAESIADDLLSEESVALGFEAPLFIPVPHDVERLSRGRQGDGNRSWAAPAGGYVATLALHQAAWLLRRLYPICAGTCDLTVDPARWSCRPAQPPLLFCWEAFVSGPAHTVHMRDAATAAMYFQAQQYSLATAVTATDPLSLFGCAVVWSGWSTDVAWLRLPLLVLRPVLPWNGDLGVV
jgi:hypothetical protein